MSKLIKPHGGELKDLYLSKQDAETEKQNSQGYQSWDLSPRQLCDLELLLNGGYSPLEGFLTEKDYTAVVDSMHLDDGTLWPMPITLDVSQSFADSIKTGESIALRDREGVMLAVMDITDIWIPDKDKEAKQVFGSNDQSHPGVHYLHNIAGAVYIGGKIKGIEAATHYDYKHLRDTPQELRTKFEKWGWSRIAAFHTHNPMHRAQQELTYRAAQEEEVNLLIHPVVGVTQEGDDNHYSRVRCYQHILDHYPEQTTMLSLLGLAMRMAGPREAIWHAIVRKNHGCSHFIVGRDHAGAENNDGESFYGPYAAQELLNKHQDELEIKIIPFQKMIYVEEKAGYHPQDEVPEGLTIFDISDTEIRRRLQAGLDIPDWFSYKEIITELRRANPPRHKQGFTVFFTGLSGSGKSTLANALMIKMLESGTRRVTLLDGDIVRKNLSSELGFSKEHRNINILRIGYVASEITKYGGVAICAPIAPYTATRRQIRNMISPVGGFIEVHVATSLEVCESRDRKGLYAKARQGIIKEFTGISDPYEIPENPEIRINTAEYTPDEAAHRILLKLENMGFIK